MTALHALTKNGPLSSLRGVALREGHWIEIPEALMNGAARRHSTSAACICAITSTGADLMPEELGRIYMYKALHGGHM